MTDKQSDVVATIDASTAETDSTQDTAKQARPSKTRGLWLISVVNSLLVLALCACAYWVWLQWQQQQSQKVDIGALVQTQVNELEATLRKQASTDTLAFSEQSKALSAMQTAIDAQTKELDTQAQQSALLQQRVSELAGRRPADWLLAEADYLVRMAGRKLWLENDVASAMMILQAADARLEDLGDPSLFPIRKFIAADIQSLHQINPVATSSVALALSGMLEQVNNLAIDSVKLPEPVVPQGTNELSENVQDWRDNLAKTWQAIMQDFITITRRDKPVEPFLAEKQQWLVKEQLKLALAQAQAAALAENSTLYQASLQQALALLVEYYDLEQSAVAQFMAALQQLQSTDVSKTYPSKLSAQDALSELLKERMQNMFNNGAGEL